MYIIYKTPFFKHCSACLIDTMNIHGHTWSIVDVNHLEWWLQFKRVWIPLVTKTDCQSLSFTYIHDQHWILIIVIDSQDWSLTDDWTSVYGHSRLINFSHSFTQLLLKMWCAYRSSCLFNIVHDKKYTTRSHGSTRSTDILTYIQYRWSDLNDN